MVDFPADKLGILAGSAHPYEIAVDDIDGSLDNGGDGERIRLDKGLDLH